MQICIRTDITKEIEVKIEICIFSAFFNLLQTVPEVPSFKLYSFEISVNIRLNKFLPIESNYLNVYFVYLTLEKS